MSSILLSSQTALFLHRLSATTCTAHDSITSCRLQDGPRIAGEMIQGTGSSGCPWVLLNLHPVSPIFDSTANVADMGSSAGLLTGGATAGPELTQGIGFGGAPPATVGWLFTEVIAAPVTPVRPACRDSNVAAVQRRPFGTVVSGTLEGRYSCVEQGGRYSRKTFLYSSV